MLVQRPPSIIYFGLIVLLAVAAACGNGSSDAEPTNEAADQAQATFQAATIAAGGPTATPLVGGGHSATTIPNQPSRTSEPISSTTPPSPTPPPRTTTDSNAADRPPAIGLALLGPPIMFGEIVGYEIQLTGAASDIAAFNFDIVYDQRLVELDAPEPALDALDTVDREFSCNLPEPSGDVDSDPDVGRARLVCFSFGGVEAEAPDAPLTLATVSVRGVRSGTAALQFENVAVFTSSEEPVIVSAVPATVVIE